MWKSALSQDTGRQSPVVSETSAELINNKRCGWFSLRARHRGDAQYKKLVDNGSSLADSGKQPKISDNSMGVMRENSNPHDNSFRQKKTPNF